jgi:glutamine cyclotransferase
LLILILILLLIIIFPISNNKSDEFAYLEVIKKYKHPRYNICFRVIMKSENNRIITSTGSEIYYLVKVGDIINAKIRRTNEWDGENIKYYKLSNIEFIKQ